MAGRKFLGWLNGRREGTGRTNSRPHSQPGGTTTLTQPQSLPPLPDWPPAPKIVNRNKPTKLSSYIIDPTAAYENKPDWESARLDIDVVKESPDVSPLLKSVVGGLSAVLRHYNQKMAIWETIRSLIPRVEGLAESLSVPAPKGEIKEIERRWTLRRKLEKVLQDLEPLAEGGKTTGALNDGKDAETLASLAHELRNAMMDYQTALQQNINYRNYQLIDKVDLSLLKGIHPTAGAGFLARDGHGCLRGTRKDVLLEIEKWLMDERDQRVFWLNGLAGTGKSAIAQTFSEISFADGKLGASFFCSQDFEGRSNLQAIFPTLAFQLARRYPQFREHLLPVLRANRDVRRESLGSQFEKLIVRPLEETRIPTLIIIDALDECRDKEPASALLSVLSRYAHKIPDVKFLITGRSEPPTQKGLRLESFRPITGVRKLEPSSGEDIKLYLRTRLTDIRETRNDCEFPEVWPTSHDIKFLYKVADGLFLYASTIIRFVTSEYHPPTERLDLIISHLQDADLEKGIDFLYVRVLRLGFQNTDPGEQEIYSRFRNVVGAVLLVFHPLSKKSLSYLVRNCGTPSQVSATLHLHHSLLNVPDSEDEPIQVCHKSFPDFLTDPTRCRDEQFLVDRLVHHENILFSCLDLMEKRLKKNICGLDDYTVLSEVEDLSTLRGAYIGNSLDYACRFWTRHLASLPGNGPHVERVQEAIDEFFKKHLLCWIEVLSIVEHLGVAVYAINDIRQWCISAGISTSKQADDSECFIVENFDLIQDSPSHIYHSALSLSPSSSWIRECYKEEVVREPRVLMGLPDQWTACSRTISLQDEPSAVAHRGDVIAVGMPRDVVLIDAITGVTMSILSGHTGVISSLGFSQDGTLLVSRSDDNTVKLWDVQTGGVVRTLGGGTLVVSAVSISPDGATVALGTEDGAISLWDVQTGGRRPVEIRQSGAVRITKFSPIDPQRLISSSWDGRVREWNVDGSQIGTSYHETDGVSDLSYAFDGTRFVSCGGRVATVRDSDSGAVVVKLDAPDRTHLDRCCFSPDGRFIVCAAGTSICVWDITISEARPVKRLVGHSDYITSLTFSSSIVSGSEDKTVKFWQSSSLLSDSTTPVQMAPFRGSAPIESVNLFAEQGTIVTSDSSGVVKTWDLATGICKSSFSTPAEGKRDLRLADDTLIIVWCALMGEEYHIWDVYQGQLLQTTRSSLSVLVDLKISGDGSKIFGLGPDYIEAVSMRTGEDVGRVSLRNGGGYSLWVRGNKVGLGNSRSKGWDFGGREVSYFEESPDRSRLDLADYSADHGARPRWIEDTVTRRIVFRLPERFMEIHTGIGWDGRYLLIWSSSGEVVIMDFV